MKKYIILTSVVLTTFISYGQSEGSLDERSKYAPDSLRDAWSIANYLSRDLNTDRDKVRAFFVWITHNISYDTDQLINPLNFHSQEQRKENVLLVKSGICMDYSILFLDMCKAAGIEAYYVSGYTQRHGEIARRSHAWNAVCLDSAYYLLDATWAAGYGGEDGFIRVFKNKYYLTRPEEFVKTHIPFDPIWQFLDNPISHAEFEKKDFSKLDEPGTYPYLSIISEYNNADKLTQLEAIYNRMAIDNATNVVFENELKSSQQQIFLEKYRTGLQGYEIYRIHRYKKFKKPSLSDKQIQELFDRARDGLVQADAQSIVPRSAHRPYNYAVAEAKHNLSLLMVELRKEQEALDKYFKTPRPFRFFRHWKVD